jgi:hypothetical protein
MVGLTSGVEAGLHAHVAIAGPIRRARAPNLPIRDLKTMEMQIEEENFAERIMSRLSGGVAVLATILAAAGLCGVLAFNVARRTREIGFRIALKCKRVCHNHKRDLIFAACGNCSVLP